MNLKKVKNNYEPVVLTIDTLEEYESFIGIMNAVNKSWDRDEYVFASDVILLSEELQRSLK